MSDLVEMPSGLIVPETALPPPPPPPSHVSIEGTFDTKEAAEKWVDQCVVRWEWSINLVEIPADDPDEPSKWKPNAHRTKGQIHNKTYSTYVKDNNDVPLTSYVEVVKEQIEDETLPIDMPRPVVYRIVNKV